MNETSETQQFEDNVLNRAVMSLAASTGLQVSIAAIPPKQGQRLDGAVVIKNGKRSWKSYVEIKTQLTSHALGSAVASVSEIKKQHGNTALVVSFVNPLHAEKLRELGVEFFDAAGNAFFQREGLYVFVTGRKAREGRMRDTRGARAFNPTGSRLVFALLCQPGLEDKPYRHLANRAGVSLGAVGWIMSDLKSLGHLADRGTRGRRAGNDYRLYEDCVDLLQEGDFDYAKASARMLGRDIGPLLVRDSQPVIETVLTEATDETGSGALRWLWLRTTPTMAATLMWRSGC